MILMLGGLRGLPVFATVRTADNATRNGVISVVPRHDRVRRSSCASFILELRFERDNGMHADMHLSVSSEGNYTKDGKMQADVIYLYPEQIGNDITAGGRSVYSATTLEALCNLLLEAATVEGWRDPMAERNAFAAHVNGRVFAIDGRLKCYDSHRTLAARIECLGGTVFRTVSSETDYLICNNKDAGSRKATKARQLGVPMISDFDFLCGLFGRNTDVEDRDTCSDSGITVSAAAVAPITAETFKRDCAEAGMTLENLKKITVRNNKFGNRDGAMFIFSDNAAFYAYRKRYANAPEEQKEQIAEEFVAFVKNGPVLEVNDNEFELPPTMRCVWAGSDEELEEAMRVYLAGGGPGHWMGTYSMEFALDYAERNVTTREVLFFGNI